MKKIFVLAVCLFACSTVMAAQNNPPQNDSRYQWNENNCKDARVETRVNNQYYTGGNKSQVTQTTPQGSYEARTTVYNSKGQSIDNIHTNRDMNSAKSHSRGYNEDVTAKTECKWNE